MRKDIIIYHGSDTLKEGFIPDPYFSPESNDFNGSFFSFNKKLAKEFGSVHSFKINKNSLIFDSRKKECLDLIKEYVNLRPDQFNKGLPLALSNESDEDFILEIKRYVKSIGYNGWILSEKEWGSSVVSIEIWNKEIIKK